MELIQRQRNAFIPSFVSYLSSKRQIFSRTVKFSGYVLDANRFVFNDWDTRHKCDRDQEAEDAVTISWRYLEVFVFDDIFHSNLARTRFGHQRSHLVLGSWIWNKATATEYIFSLKKKYVSPSVYHQYHCHHCNQRGRLVWGGAGVPRQHQCLSSISFLFRLKHPTRTI